MSMTIDEPTLRAVKEQARRTWASGDYDAVATGIWEVGERIVRRVGVRPGERVLDVAAGTGNAAIRAASAGASVTALDLTPELFPAGRRRAQEAGVELEWVEGDAEALPFDDESFDVVVSTFGVMFAPRHEVAAREMARVLRPGGRIGLASWVPDGTIAHLFTTVAAELPPPPPFAQPPLAWGDPVHVTALFAGTGIEPAAERDALPIDPDVAIDEATEFYLNAFGPLVTARRTLSEQGRWDELAARLPAVIERMLREPAEFLVVTGTKH